VSGQERSFAPYIEAVSVEIGKYPRLPLSTIYIGGGTPTVLEPENFKKLFHSIRDTFNCMRISEISAEANPESLTDEKLVMLRAAGVNRLSIGAQSFSDEELKYLGRIHTSSDFDRAFRSARRLKFANINVDLIFGLPGRRLRLENKYRKGRFLQPGTYIHLSAYDRGRNTVRKKQGCSRR